MGSLKLGRLEDLNLREFVRTSVILTPARDGEGPERQLVDQNAGQNRANHDPALPTFWLEFETPIEVQRFEAPFGDPYRSSAF